MANFFARILITVLMASPIVTYACSCGRTTLQSLYDSRPYVLTAVFTSVRSVDEKTASYEFSVTEHIKGNRKGRELVAGKSTSMCGAAFEIGREYLLFLTDSREIGLCSGAQKIREYGHTVDIQGLRDYGSGRATDLSPPWQFRDNHGVCSLNAWFDYIDEPQLGHDRIDFFYRYAFSPRQIAFGNPMARPGYLGAHIKLRFNPRNDSGRFALVTGGKRYPASWRKNFRGNKGTYVIAGKQIEHLLQSIIDTKELSFDSLLLKQEIKGNIKTTRIGDSLERFQECVQQISQAIAN